MDNIFLDKESCLQYFCGKKICVFGICRESDEFVRELQDKLEIVVFIDNNKCGKNSFYNNRNVISVAEYFSNHSNIPVIITPSKFCFTICKQFESLGGVIGKNVFIWDNNHVFKIDKNSIDLIDYFNKVFKDKNIEKTKNTVLISFDNCHEKAVLLNAYLSNYLAVKYNSEIKAYCRFGFDKENISPCLEKIYKSFNVKDIVSPVYSSIENAEVVDITNDLWKNLNDWNAWKNIYIYGIHFGTTLLRDFFRRFLPPDNIKDDKLYQYLKTSVSIIVFWYHYFEYSNVNAVLLGDGTNWDGFIRDIAITKGIPTYCVTSSVKKLTLDYAEKSMFQHFDEMWLRLTDKEQQYGLKWAEKELNKRINGDTTQVADVDKQNFVFALNNSDKRYVKKSNNLKVMICPHSFEEDCYWYGEHIFDDNYYSWLEHLGELSLKTKNYDWYLKEHPSASKRDKIIINRFLKKYTNIMRIPAMVSPKQLKEEGISFALTECGTIGHEYPLLCIQVVNAGINPHSKFDFNWNPQSKEEFDDIIFNLPNLKLKTDKEGLLKFYCLKYLYYDWDVIPYKKIFFKNKILTYDRKELISRGLEPGSWLYEEFLKEQDNGSFDRIWDSLSDLFRILDEWKDSILYKRELEINIE